MKKFTLLFAGLILSVFVSAQTNLTNDIQKSTKGVKFSKEKTQHPRNAFEEAAPVSNHIKSTRQLRSAYWNVQFNYDLSAGAEGQAGIETDGNFIYVTKWASDTIFRYKMDGTLQDTIIIAGVTGLRDLAYDGTYFYGGAASNNIYQLDFTPGAEALVSTITAPANVEVRHISYNEDSAAFWVGNWATDMFLVNMTGAIIDTILATNHGLTGLYGSAYDNETAGGPYLWTISTDPEGYISRLKISDASVTVIHDINDDVTPAPATIGGGLFIHPDMLASTTGTTTLGGLYQGTPNGAFGYDLASCNNMQLDIAIDTVYSPNNDAGCALTSTENVSVRIINLGEDTVDTDFDIAYIINGAGLVTETITNTEFLPGATMDYTFTVTEDLSALASYSFQVYTIYSADEDNNNDTVNFSAYSTTESMSVKIITDGYPSEVSWVVINTLTGDTIEPSPVYTVANDTTITNVCTSENGCYKFILKDSYGDAGSSAIVYYNGTSVDTIFGDEYTYDAEINYFGFGCPVDDASVIAILTPNNDTTCVLSAADTVTVQIINYGLSVISGTLPVAYTLDGGTAVQETITLAADLDHLDTLQYTFTATVDLSGVTDYEVKAYTELVGDGNSLNDTSMANVISTDGQIEVMLYTDGYGSETSWLIINQANDTIAEMVGFTSNSTYSFLVCVDDADCYTFITNDSYGDGGVSAAIYYNNLYVDTIIGTDYDYTEQIGYIGNGCPQEGDLVINGYIEYPTSPVTLQYQINVEVSNQGNVINEEIKVFADVVAESYTDTVVTTNPFAIGASQMFTYDSLYNPTTVGVKQIRFEADYTNDLDLTNNIDTVEINISDSVLTRDWSDIPTGSIGLETGSAGAFGHPFTILGSDTLTSVSFLTVEAPNGEITSADVYEFNGTVGALIASSVDFTFTQSDSAWYTLVFMDGVVLNAGTYFVAINQINTNISIASSTNYYTNNTLWYNVSGGAWTDATGSFDHTLFLRLNFGNIVYTGVENIESNSNISLYPNPANDFITIETSSVISNVQIVDIAGKTLIQENNVTSSIDIKDLPKGIYFVKIQLENKTIVRKLIKE